MRFFLISIGVVTLGYLYLWRRLVRDMKFSRRSRWAIGTFLLLTGLALPARFLLGRHADPALMAVLEWPAFTTIGLLFLLIVALTIADFVRLGLFLRRRYQSAHERPVDPARRALLGRSIGMSASLGAGVAGIGGVVAARALSVTEIDITLSRLPQAADGFSIVQISDLHIGATIGRAFVEDVVRRVNAQKPDLVAITGDLVDGSVAMLADTVSALGQLQSRHGTFFVTGNHEFYSGAAAWMAELRRLGIRVLDNERVSIGVGQESFDLAGVHDYRAGRVDRRFQPNMGAALKDRDPKRELILLAHQPRHIDEAASYGVGLQLSGHTHGGQIWPMNFIVRLSQPFIAGLGRQGDTQIYVNTGTGYWGPPIRVGTRAEISHIRLRAAVT